MIARLIQLARREYPAGARWLVLLILAPFFLYLIPLGIRQAASFLDPLFGFASFRCAWLSGLLGLLSGLRGLLFAGWAILAQLGPGRGTPLPLMATQSLLTRPPFSLCRNPMTFGTLLLYGGWAIWIGSISALILVLFFGILIIAYIRFIEEAELEGRFGESYRRYKSTTPFLLPRGPRKRDR